MSVPKPDWWAESPGELEIQVIHFVEVMSQPLQSSDLTLEDTEVKLFPA